MRNTGIVYKSEDKRPQIVPEFAELLPPLSDEQRQALEADILREHLAIGKPVREHRRLTSSA